MLADAPLSPRSLGSVAPGFLAEVASAPMRILAGVTGVTGSGKTSLLEELTSHFHSVGKAVHRGTASSGWAVSAVESVLLVDDAHQLPDSEITELHALVDERDTNVVVTFRPWPHPPALAKLASTLEQHHPHVILGPLSRDDIAVQAATVLGEPQSATFVDAVLEHTGGLRWLVDRVLASAASLGASAAFPDSDDAVEHLGHDLEWVGGELRELLLAISVGFDLSAEVPASLLDSRDRFDDLVAEARAGGLLLADGHAVPIVREALIRSSPVHHVRSLQRELVDSAVAHGAPLESIARTLAHDGFHDQRVASTLSRAADAALAQTPALAAELYDEATAAGADRVSIAARRAQAASATGDLDGAARILDDLLAHDPVPDLARAVDASASVWAQRGMLCRSAEIYRWFGGEKLGASATLAAVVLAGVGEGTAAAEMLEASTDSTSPTLINVGMTLMAQGVLDSITGSTASALPSLVRASDMITASATTAPLPESPAVLAALLALNNGELDVADSVTAAALQGGQCGAAARPRLLLVQAWAAMLDDRPRAARALIASALEGAATLTPRDNLLRRALELGLARRADDLAGITAAWHEARESILHVPVDLYSLLPLGELIVAAARLRDSEWLEQHVAEAWSLLDALGNPPAWSLPLHWSAVQAAILREQPEALAPHAAALVRASVTNSYAAVLATAGREWIAVLAGEFDVGAVESAARGLASVGLTWDGSRLVGHAAARAADRRDMARLLSCARALHPIVPQEHGPLSRQPAPVRGGRDASGLSSREREVARFVLEGRTYREIGAAMFVSPRTAEHHIAQIRRRLGATTRSELLAKLRLALSADELSVD